MNTAYGNESAGQDMLSEFEVNLVQANTGKRFANYLIDIIINFVILLALLVVYSAFTGFEPGGENENGVSKLVNTIVYSVLLAAIYGLTEGIFKGKTLGKLITGTRAVNMDGTRISFQTAFLRGLSRMAPFEAFSALGSSPSYPWHDRWTKTFVVDEKQSIMPAINK